MKITTGFDFQGYVITEYIDVVFDEIIVGIGLGKAITSTIDNAFSRITGSEATEITDRLNDIKTKLRKRVEQNAQKAGANALIGVDFESSKLGDLIMVSMTATAVRIEQLADFNPNTVERKLRDDKEEEIKKKEEERQRRIEEQIALMGDDVASQYRIFIVKCQECQRFSEIKAIWNELTLVEDDTYIKITEELNKYVMLEKMYGGTTQEKIEGCVSYVSSNL